MNICIAGKNNIAIDVCRYVVEHYPQANVYGVVNRNETEEDGWQKSYLKYIQFEPKVILSTMEQMYEIEDLVFLSTEFDRIIRPHLFKTNQLYNIHFSLLPAYKGVYPSVWPILNGEEYAGVTLHKMDQGIDTGDIIAQKRFKLSSKETSFSLYTKLITEGTKLVVKHIDSIITNRYKAYPQPAIGSTYYSKTSIDYANLTIDLNVTAAQLDRQIRAFYFPAYQVAQVYGHEIFRTKITTEKSVVKPGSIIENSSKWLKLSTIDYNILLCKKSDVVEEKNTANARVLRGGGVIRPIIVELTAQRRALAA